jgi:hypothetical protein
MKDAINFTFVQELRVFGFDAFQFDGHLFSGSHIGSQVDVSKRPASDLAT